MDSCNNKTISSLVDDEFAASLVASLSGMKRPSDTSSDTSNNISSYGVPARKKFKLRKDHEDDHSSTTFKSHIMDSSPFFSEDDDDANDFTSRTLEPPPFFYYRNHSDKTDDDPFSTLSRVPTFPDKVHSILSDPTLSDVVAWMPHGRSWKILKPREFEIRVIPVYFDHQKMSSFIRQANGWGFRRITQGKDRNSYYHELFLRGMPFLSKKMKRPGVNKKQIVDVNHEPDLYAISERHPLPTMCKKVEAVGSGMPTTTNSSSNDVVFGSSLSTSPPSNATTPVYPNNYSRSNIASSSVNMVIYLRQKAEIESLQRENSLLRQLILNSHSRAHDTSFTIANTAVSGGNVGKNHSSF